MDADIVDFVVRQLPLSMFPQGGCAGYLNGRNTIVFDRLIDETASRYKVDKKQLRTDFEHVEDTAIDLVATNLWNVQFGRNVFLKPYLSGKFGDKKAKFDPAVNKIVMRAICREELKNIDYSKFTFHNATDGKVLKVRTVNAVGGNIDKAVEIGKGIAFGGDNTQLFINRPDLNPRDRVEYVCTKPDGTEVAGELEVTFSDLHRIDCIWPAEVDDSAVGGKMTFTVYGRCGEDDALPQKACVEDVAVLQGETPPVVPAPTLTGGHSQGHEANEGCMYAGSAFILSGTNLTNGTFRLQYTAVSGTVHDDPVDAQEVTVNEDGTSASLSADAVSGAVESTREGSTITVIAATAGGSASFAAESMAN